MTFIKEKLGKRVWCELHQRYVYIPYADNFRGILAAYEMYELQPKTLPLEVQPERDD